MLSIDAAGRGWVLFQPDVPDFVVFPWEALLFLRSEWMSWREVEWSGEKKWKLWLYVKRIENLKCKM